MSDERDEQRFWPEGAQFSEWQEDLNPDFLAGQNRGVIGPHPELIGLTLYDFKDVQRAFQRLTDDELKAVPVLPAGARLEQGATYIDLRDPDAHEFTAMGDMEAGPDNLYVPKANVDYLMWNRLTGVTTPERLDEPGESEKK